MYLKGMKKPNGCLFFIHNRTKNSFFNLLLEICFIFEILLTFLEKNNGVKFQKAYNH
ncbi:hypothetical protein AM202_05729 [Actinobacillus minor 202]|uniref:Uncharacterized protein n=1 Tax=Actinobacillus minor 202 TaxID=591023 RepID=A0ABP2GRA0_9PAST|nr:hypothetical protein AM202_05729 [Actinobacillus minor 202]